ncbi:hypothetical protein TeGR_g9869 [Tetraparma gracilis]|uniref:Peroxisomal membrane protein 11 n=1 Tax=Tetraparma gracilis TaxID=2962635 RepID=A0ABQ6MXR9_9STRA|nr:hypothetical protein TeGR_g9869 [Tetraparma gracilis]
MSRKAFRIGKFLNEVEKSRVILSKPSVAEGGAGGLRPYQKALMVGKCVGLGGFWAAENILLLTRGSSFLLRDDPDAQKSLAGRAQRTGARFYFAGSVAFFLMSVRDIYEHDRKVEERAKDPGATAEELEKLQLKRFSLYVNLTKSICDMIVFSNITGVDLHRKFRGKPLSEGIVSVAGLASASTVLFNNYPKAKK